MFVFINKISIEVWYSIFANKACLSWESCHNTTCHWTFTFILVTLSRVLACMHGWNRNRIYIEQSHFVTDHISKHSCTVSFLFFLFTLLLLMLCFIKLLATLKGFVHAALLQYFIFVSSLNYIVFPYLFSESISTWLYIYYNLVLHLYQTLHYIFSTISDNCCWWIFVSRTLKHLLKRGLLLLYAP